MCGGTRVLPCHATQARPGTERARRRGLCASTSVCSFACGLDEGVQAVLDSNAVPHLLRTLTNNDEKVVEAGARSLKQILNSKLAPCDQLFEPNALQQLVSLLHSSNPTVAEVSAAVLARCCKTPAQQVSLVGVMPRLLALLEADSPKSHAAALDLLAALTEDNQAICQALLVRWMTVLGHT